MGVKNPLIQKCAIDERIVFNAIKLTNALLTYASTTGVSFNVNDFTDIFYLNK